MKCPTCGVISPATSRFCERDGTRLVADAAVAAHVSLPVCACGSTVFDEGFCTTCGRSVPRASRRPGTRESEPDGSPDDLIGRVPGRSLLERSSTELRDHVEQAPVVDLAGVTDRGQRHPWNEDALSLAADSVPDPVYILVVCDGVSQARNAQEAAQVAADVARGCLLKSTRDQIEPTIAIRQAVQAAHLAVCALPDNPPASIEANKDQAPGCTLVAALVRTGHATIGWVGDSRAYRFGPDLCQLLTHDHSWFNAVVDSGELSPIEAAASLNANAILRAVGPLNFDDGAPPQAPVADVMSCDLLPGHLLLLCTDGLWKYAPEPHDLAGLLREFPSTAGPLELSRKLVEYANTRGGTDNVTAAILRQSSAS